LFINKRNDVITTLYALYSNIKSFMSRKMNYFKGKKY